MWKPLLILFLLRDRARWDRGPREPPKWNWREKLLHPVDETHIDVDDSVLYPDADGNWVPRQSVLRAAGSNK